MGQRELRCFRLILLKKLQALEHHHRGEELPSLANGNADSMDQASMEFEADLFFQFHERKVNAIEEIYRALGRIEEGTFGICEDCEERITRKRLWANPSATLCIECQKMREQQERNNIWNGKRPLIFSGA